MRQFSIQELLFAVRRLPPATPQSDALFKSGYDSHKDHWIGWLEEYNSPGYYGRSDTTISDAKTVYQRLGCAPMIIWLAEAAGASPVLVRQAILEMQRLGGNGGTHQAARVARQIFPWEQTAALLFRR